MKKIFALCLLAVFTANCFSGCAGNVKPLSATRFLLDTAVTITLYGGADGQTLSECFSLCEKYDKMFGVNSDGGDIAEINRSCGAPVGVSDDTADLLRLTLDLSQKSGGVFDPTIYPVKRLWNFDSEDPELPNAADIAEALKKVDYRNVTVNGNTVTTANGAMLDLGGIAKGYIADKMRDLLIKNHAERAVIDLGGNICCVGDGPFRVGIKKPYTSNGVIATVSVEGGAVTTSGRYERYFTVGERQYHHILDPKTGYPVENDLLGVTVICDNSTLADFLSTAVFIMGFNAGSKFLAENGAEGVFVFSDESIKLTEGLKYGVDGDIVLS